MDWDLKLGRVMEEGRPVPVPVPLARRRRASSSSSSSSSSAAAEQLTCLVEGCTSDLTACREYHRRHRVCERHSKTPVVLVAGLHQRFCQQCSRFQLLGEFDDAKRSCRKRLEGHNRRRRKTQPESGMAAQRPPVFHYQPPMPPSATGWPHPSTSSSSSSFVRDRPHIDCALSLLSSGAPLHHHHHQFHGGSATSSAAAANHSYDCFDVDQDHAGEPCRMFPFTWDFK